MRLTVAPAVVQIIIIVYYFCKNLKTLGVAVEKQFNSCELLLGTLVLLYYEGNIIYV